MLASYDVMIKVNQPQANIYASKAIKTGKFEHACPNRN
jgi:hypothetical protein